MSLILYSTQKFITSMLARKRLILLAVRYSKLQHIKLSFDIFNVMATFWLCQPLCGEIPGLLPFLQLISLFLLLISQSKKGIAHSCKSFIICYTWIKFSLYVLYSIESRSIYLVILDSMQNLCKSGSFQMLPYPIIIILKLFIFKCVQNMSTYNW